MKQLKNVWVFEVRNGRHPQWHSVAYNADMTAGEVDQCEIDNGNSPMAVWGPYADFDEADLAIKEIADEYFANV